MNNFEWLLKDLGWVRTHEELFNGPGGTYLKNVIIDPLGNKHDYVLKTYDFISSIPIEDWKKYKQCLAYLVGLNESEGYWVGEDEETFHNAPLDARIEAHCRARGMK
jgi:hypothetical protein